jgi:hypothetical protein
MGFNLYVAISCDIAPCSVYMIRRFGGTYHFYLQGKKISQARNGLHGAIFQKMATFITTAVTASEPA